MNTPDDQFSATLTSKMEDEDPDSDALFFTSTLLIIDPVNGSELICSGDVSGAILSGTTTVVVLSGTLFYSERKTRLIMPNCYYCLAKLY